MVRFLAIAVAISAFAPPLWAEEALVDVPPGVLIFDAEPAETVAETAPPAPVVDPVLAAPVMLAPTITGSATASLRSPSVPLVILEPNAPEPSVTLQAPVEAMPMPEPSYTLRYAGSGTGAPLPRKRPQPKVDPVTGRLRDTPGWTGRTDAPASIGCFPEGACAVLNQR